MDIFTALIVLVIVGVLLYLVNRFVPMDGKVKTILNWAVVIGLIIWLVKITGILDSLKGTSTHI